LKYVEGLSQREIHRRTGVHRDTIRNALASRTPPVYGPRPPRPSKLEPFVAVIEELLAEAPTLSGVRVREELEKLGYVGGKTILDDLLRELRPRFLPRRAAFSARVIAPASWRSSISVSRARRSRSAGARRGAAISSPASCPTRARSRARWCSPRSSRISRSG
jgi:transposase